MSETNGVETNQAERIVIFSVDDVKAVSNALLNEYWSISTGDYSTDHCICDHCGGVSDDWVIDSSKIKHTLTCPVIIARDLLTRI